MVIQKEKDMLTKARKLVEAAEQKAHNKVKKLFSVATMEAHRWRISGKLKACEIHESGKGVRWLC
jgi:vacuolar-type H+-ATPase subunit H